MSKLPPPTKDNTGNSIGNKALKEVITKAKENLPLAKEVEQNKIKAGFKWVTNGKTSKLIHPDKIKDHLKDGYHLTKKKL